jgi:pimeloyl-ACP methyl ester carboxylesterase
VPPSVRPVLLLHGQPGGARDWDRVLAALSGRADAVAIDRPGWDGHSEPRDLAGNAEAALDALDARKIDRATIVGHSLGGAIAVWLAAHHPERVTALVLAAPAANLAALEPFDRWLTLPVAGPLTSAATLTGLGLALSTGPVRRLIARRSKLEDGYLRASGRALLTSWARRAFDAEQRALVRDLPTLERRLVDVVAPTWIVTGAEDRIVPPAAPRTLANQIEGARLMVMDRAGHLLPQLHARRLGQAILLALDAVETV